MQNEGPPLELLLHRLSNCPVELYEHACQSPVLVRALVCDYFRQQEASCDIQPVLRLFDAKQIEKLQWMPLAVWLLMHPWFKSRADLAEQMLRVFGSQPIVTLAGMIKVTTLVSDPDRREELVRLVLRELNLRPKGETHEQAVDRLTTLDTVERARVLQATAAAERRAREVREAMARKRAQEAASRYGE